MAFLSAFPFGEQNVTTVVVGLLRTVRSQSFLIRHTYKRICCQNIHYILLFRFVTSFLCLSVSFSNILCDPFPLSNFFFLLSYLDIHFYTISFSSFLHFYLNIFYFSLYCEWCFFFTSIYSLLF